eukprot:gene18567-22165_t
MAIPCGFQLQDIHAEANVGGSDPEISWGSFLVWNTYGNISGLQDLCGEASNCTGQAEWSSGAHYGTDFANLKLLEGLSLPELELTGWSTLELETFSVGIMDHLGNLMTSDYYSTATYTAAGALQIIGQGVQGLVWAEAGILMFNALSVYGEPGEVYTAELTVEVKPPPWSTTLNPDAFSVDTSTFAEYEVCGSGCWRFRLSTTVRLHPCVDGMVFVSSSHRSCELCVASKSWYSYMIRVKGEEEHRCLMAPFEGAIAIASDCYYGSVAQDASPLGLRQVVLLKGG